jgi:hypothetical protein
MLGQSKMMQLEAKKTSLKDFPKFPALTTYPEKELYKFISAVINWHTDLETTIVNKLSDLEFAEDGEHEESIKILQEVLGEI